MFYENVMLGAGQTASCALEGIAESDNGVAAPVVGKVPTPFKPQKGEWFDEDFDFVGPEGDAFVNAILDRITATEVRTRKRKAIDEPNHRLLIRKLAANGFRAFRWFDPALVAVQVGPKAYQGRGGPWLNGDAVGREIRLLETAGLIEINGGIWGEVSTTFRPTDDFVIAAMNAKLSDGNIIHRLAPDRLIRVYRTNSDDGEFVEFEQDDQSRQWTTDIDDYNAFMERQDIGIDLSRAETVHLLARMNAERQVGTPRLKQPDLTSKSLFRQFNFGGFDAGGRLYGPWWVNCPSELRGLLTINSEPTVELDYSSCAVRMLYHRNGLAFEGDAHFLEPLNNRIAASVWPKEKKYPRKGVKRLLQALINTKKDGRPGGVKLTGKESVRPWATEAQVVAMLREKHAPIAHEFQSEAWTWLQREDSEIALTVIGNLRKKGIVALPIHDSFIVVDGEEDELKKEMNTCYFNRFGFYPEID